MFFKKLMLTFLILVMFASTLSAKAQKRVSIGVLMDGKGYLMTSGFENIEKEVHDLLDNEYEVRFSEKNSLVGNWTRESVKTNLTKLLNTHDVDIIIAMGAISSSEVSHYKRLSKPVIAPFIMDETLQGLPRKGAGSGIKNLNYIISITPIEEGLIMFKKIVSFDCPAIMVNQAYLTSFSKASLKFKELHTDLESGCKIIPVGNATDTAISQLTSDVTAVYITPLLHISEQDRSRLFSEINKRKIPSFSHLGRDEVVQGALAGIDSKNTLSRLSRRVALNIQRILMGEKAETLPVDFRTGREQLIINMDTARQIGVYPSFSVLTDAELVNEYQEKIERKIDLFDAVNEAINTNLEFLAKQYDVASNKLDIRKARSNLFPQLELSAMGVKIDEDRAEASLGMQAEETYTGTATLTQVIFSEKAMANITIQKSLHEKKKAELDQVKQDIALTAATAYLNVLRAKTYEYIKKNNIKVTKSNLELARVRHSIGTSGPAEVFRWEAELAIGKRDVLFSERQRVQAEIHLNRMLHRPQEEPFMVLETTIDDPRILSGVYPDPKIDNPWIYRQFADFVVEYGLKKAPELVQIDEGIKAKQRYLKTTRREFYVPTIAFQGEISQLFDESGAGTSDLGALASMLPDPADDIDWSLGIMLSLPTYSGGLKSAEFRKTKMEIKHLETKQYEVKEKLEQKIRSTLIQAGTSMAIIDVSKEAAVAAQKTQDIVTDAYAKGMVSILDLIDAQNAARTAQEVSANAVYDFLIDLMNFERSINRLDFFVEPEQRGTLFKEFEEHLAKGKNK